MLGFLTYLLVRLRINSELLYSQIKFLKNWLFHAGFRFKLYCNTGYLPNATSPLDPIMDLNLIANE
jgi:hypothetical protein